MSNYTIKFEFESDNIVIDNNGSSVWAYLIDAETGKILKDVFVFSPIPPEDVFDESFVRKGSPPKLSKEFASECAFKPDVPETELCVISSGKGDYCIFLGKEPYAAIYENKKRGYSKSLSKNCAFGIPWCDNRYVQVFNSVN